MDRLALDRFFAGTEDVLEHWDGSDDAMFGEAPEPGTEDELAPPGESYYVQYDGHDEERADSYYGQGYDHHDHQDEEEIDSFYRYYENRFSSPAVVGQQIQVHIHGVAVGYVRVRDVIELVDGGPVTSVMHAWVEAMTRGSGVDPLAWIPSDLGRESGLVLRGLLRPAPTDDARIDLGYPTVAEIVAREVATGHMFPPTLPL